jgi:hypothetical protein
MKTTILIKENRTQLVLHPESEHDKSVLDVLANMPNTHRTNLYDRQGGFTMFTEYDYDSSNKDLMIVFDQPASHDTVTDLAATNPDTTPHSLKSAPSRPTNKEQK